MQAIINFFSHTPDAALKVIRWVAVLLLTPVALLAGASSSVMELYGEGAIVAARREYVYDNDRLLLGAYNNGLSAGYAALPALAREAGLDFLVSWTNDDFMDLCEAEGIGVIAKGYNAPPNFMGLPEENKAQWLALDAGNYRSHPALWGDDFLDEPWTSHMETMKDVIDHYNTLGTGRLPYINLLPIHAGRSMFAEDSLVPLWMEIALPLTGCIDGQFDCYRQHVGAYLRNIDTDVISLDIYPYNVSDTHDDWLHNLDILAEACRETDRDLWVITQAAGNERDHMDGTNKRYCDSKAAQLQQGYASMAFGAKAIIYACFQDGWWDAASHMVTAAGERTETYSAVQAANAEFAPFAKLYGAYAWKGAYLVNSLKAAGTRYRSLSNGLPKSGRLSISTSAGLVVGCFGAKEGPGEAYVLANMNELLNEEAAACTIRFPQGKTVTVYGGGEVKTYEDGGKVKLCLAPGDGRFITVG